MCVISSVARNLNVYNILKYSSIRSLHFGRDDNKLINQRLPRYRNCPDVEKRQDGSVVCQDPEQFQLSLCVGLGLDFFET